MARVVMQVELCEDGEYYEYTISGLNRSQCIKAIDRLEEDGGEVNILKEWKE